jgi:hypothetical protein
VLLGAGASIISSNVLAAQMNLGGVQRAFIAKPDVIKQQCAEWCWAASASMIFSALGHPVDQKRIVERVFSGLVCRSSGSPGTIARVLSSPWIDDSGQPFHPNVVAAYDPIDGIDAISNGFMANELDNERPILYCNKHHAMVVVDFDYTSGPAGIVPQAAGVLDPWPFSPDYHPLSLPEMTGITRAPWGEMTFLAAVQI